MNAEASVGLELVSAEASLDRPTFVGAMPGQSQGILVAEQGGRVCWLSAADKDDGREARELLDLKKRLPNYADRGNDQFGLLGLALGPKFEENGFVYLHYTALRPKRNIVSRWVLSDEGVIDPTSEQILIEQRQPFATNNGGGIAFGPDGYLYIGIGDGGAHGDPRNHAQNLGSLLGKVLRIDVSGKDEKRGLSYSMPTDNPFLDQEGARPEVYVYGLSNPWRFSFDQKTGELWLGDVGENDWEEINLIKKGGNYGWPWFEGAHPLRKPKPGEDLSEDIIAPVFEYPHTEGKAIVGGHVYRGKQIPELVGCYVYTDYISGKVWALKIDDQGEVQPNTLLLTVPHPSGFGEDYDGELLICSFGKNPNKPGDDAIYRLVPTVKK